jgi:hypothetical protein
VYTPATAFFATEIPCLPAAAATVGIAKVPNPDGDYSICFCNVRVTVKHNCFVPKLNIIFNSLVPV